MYLNLRVKIPAIIESIVVYFLLRYRKKHYGFAFRRIKLITNEHVDAKHQYTIVDQDDYQKLAGYPWQLFENKSGSFYAVQFNNGRFIKMHRVIMNAPPGKIVDHRNHEGLDNTKRNLRFATIAQNNYNNRKVKNRSSKYKGVCRRKERNKWHAYISYNCKKIHLGYFDNEEDAARVYDNAAKLYHGEFAVLNFP
ncbi:MAG: AP2 domain-containing protein [Phycisphaerae bacterium]|nr:AP2 domain-containing protein [Phycisphaerae bacterium]